VRLLIDTNIVLELLLGQSRSAEAQGLMAKTAEHDLFISDFALHSIGLLLVRQGKLSAFGQFVSDIVVNAGMQVISVPAEEIDSVLAAVSRFQLDFDDAYQYAIAQKHDLTIVSCDADFDRTTRGRRLPADIPAS